MNQFILAEVNFFLTSFLFGALLFLAYDILVILRNIIRHAKFVMAIEDIGFWTTAGILIFFMMYNLNDGIIRYYAIISIILGMRLYQIILSKHIIHIGSTFGLWIKKLLIHFFRFVTTPLRVLFKQLRKVTGVLRIFIRKRAKYILDIVKKQLQKWIEKVKMNRKKRQTQKQLDPKEPEKIRGVLELIMLPSEKGELYDEAIEEKKKKRA